MNNTKLSHACHILAFKFMSFICMQKSQARARVIEAHKVKTNIRILVPKPQKMSKFKSVGSICCFSLFNGNSVSNFASLESTQSIPVSKFWHLFETVGRRKLILISCFGNAFGLISCFIFLPANQI